jgi:hypothetical protein
MTEHVRPELRAALRERLAKKGISPDGDFSEYPVEAVCVDSVPYVGNVHLPAGMVIRRKDIDRKFRT